jgi:hypothetical protein
MIGFGITPRIPFSKNGGYDADAITYFNLVGDIPTFAKDAINDRIVAFKANGTWTGLKQCLLFPYTESKTEILRDARHLTITAELAAPAAITTPFITRAAYGSNGGVSFDTNGVCKTNLVPSVSLTLNSTCIAIGFPSDTTAKAAFSLGCFTGATQTMTFMRRDAGNACYADAYNNTVGTGRASQAGADGGKGVYIMNRQSNTNFKLRKNGSTIASSTSGGGTLPSNQFIINNLS